MEEAQTQSAVTEKPWWQSRTLRVNAVAAMLVALESGTGILQPFLPINLYTAMAVGLPIVNALLRVITSSGVKL
jgi:hypothetical protein